MPSKAQECRLQEYTFPEDVWLIILHHVFSQSRPLIAKDKIAVQEEIALTRRCLTIALPKGPTDRFRSKLMRDYAYLQQTQTRPDFCRLILKADKLLSYVPDGGLTLWVTPNWFHLQLSDPSIEIYWFKPLLFNEANLDDMIPASL